MIIDFINLNGGGGGSYTLPIASNSTLGGIKVGSGLTINPESGLLSADAQAVTTATTGTTGVVKIGENINVKTDGTISVDLSDYAKSEVLSGYVETDTLSGYVETSAMSGYVETSALSGYVQTETLSGYVETNELENYAEKSDLNDYATNDSLSAYVQTSAMSGYVQTDRIATTAQTGIVKIGSGLTVAADGTISAEGGSSVSTATTATTGVVKVGDGLDITEQGTLSTKVQSLNVGNNIIHIWLGTQTQYDNLSPNYDSYTLYVIS